MFLFRANVILDELARHAPQVASAVAEASRGFKRDGLFVRSGKETFGFARRRLDRRCRHGEDGEGLRPAGRHRMVGCRVVVVSLGNLGEGSNTEMSSGDRSSRSTARSAFFAPSRKDWLSRSVSSDWPWSSPQMPFSLPTLSRSQDVKAAVELLRERGDEAAVSASEVFRPWGSYQRTDRGDRFQTKRLVVKPGGRLSLQKHHHRSEHWVVVSGTAEVTIGDAVRLLQENEFDLHSRRHAAPPGQSRQGSAPPH